MKAYKSVSVLSLLVLIVGLVSCRGENEEYFNGPFIPDNNTFSLATTYLSGDTVDWVVKSDDESIVKVSVEGGQFFLRPQSKGKTIIRSLYKRDNTEYLSHVEVVRGERVFPILEITSLVEVIDETYKKSIEDEIVADLLLKVGDTYTLFYDEIDKGELQISRKNDNIITGTFSIDADGNYILYYDNKEFYYTLDVRKTPQLGNNDLVFYFIRDYTTYFREKYPDAGVYKVHGLERIDF